MAANQESLQGSLFQEINKKSSVSKFLKGKGGVPGEDLSDKELADDAKSRPRIRKDEKTEESFESDGEKKKKSIRKSTDTPAWTNQDLVPLDRLTPVLRHYVELKRQNPERILLYRLGDFFECFFEDAIKLSEVLELTLTGKEGGKTIGRVPMAGIPHHAAERYCSELIKKGFSIALCDQVESIANKEGALLKREITRIITPGTVIEEGMLEAHRNNWLVAVVTKTNINKEKLGWGLARADVSTGEFIVKEGVGSNELYQELLKIDAAEVITPKAEDSSHKEWCPSNLHLTETNKTQFSAVEAESTLKNHYKLSTINGLGLQEWTQALQAAGGLISYIGETNPTINLNETDTKSSQIPLELPQLSLAKDVLIIDAQTRRNLEITATQKDAQFQGSLLWAIDRTLTAMGSRCLRRWLESPLVKSKEIQSRQSVISLLVKERSLRIKIQKNLRAMGDLERLAGRAGAGQAGARELIAIANGLERLPEIASNLKKLPSIAPIWLQDIAEVKPELIKLSALLRNQIVDNPPLSLSEGGIIYDGVDQLLDGIRNQLDDQYEWLKTQENIEKENSKIANLKLQYHRTFGYFLAVSKNKAKDVPSHWIRRQTLANEERFITPTLKEREGRIFQLQARASQREYEIFCSLRDKTGDLAKEIRQCARAIAGLDSLTGLSELAATNSYVQPEIINAENSNVSRKIEIKGCRHPVVEQMLEDKAFQENNVSIGDGLDLIILSGPNASGKSCYLRQVGLTQLLAQIGSWIPASEARISIADKIFTRVGAVDDLAAGQSTFMVEMAETAFILNQATNQSLVLLDEIGRGTSTYDGLSIAWSVSEFLAQEIKSRTIFATHYHELNKISEKLSNVQNLQVLVEKEKGDIRFLHKVVPGGANKSYGIEAARLAGVPKNVIKRANEILKSLEE